VNRKVLGFTWVCDYDVRQMQNVCYEKAAAARQTSFSLEIGGLGLGNGAGNDYDFEDGRVLFILSKEKKVVSLGAALSSHECRELIDAIKKQISRFAAKSADLPRYADEPGPI
jgi:hypothetical protein